ncbi:L-seryl-tRNA(Sec) selenium transferase [Streptomyces sp. NPDC093149]|uniref:L-seryl-tRNA(Sec) selenium transferase n=1 Tax=Streptomyces sp. NPDC093149 TaxID=3366031 RepID=UPI00382933BB
MNPQKSADRRSAIPRTDTLLADPRLVRAADRIGRPRVRGLVRDAQQHARDGDLLPEQVLSHVLAALPTGPTTLRPVINATGVVVHTNLGRAPLSPAAVEAMTLASGYTDVEYDLADGTRARRGRGTIDALLDAVPAAEDAHVTTNGAAALVLIATALAQGREIIVSRGELVEIGDGFRLPDLLTSTGARLREVGTTNRTHLADYAAAVGPDTGFILKIHPSNFLTVGFTSSVSVRELSGLGVPVVADIGSGLLHADPALPDEPDATQWLGAGADLVTASGDKLLGGPQAGIVLGRRDLVTVVRRHPLARAVRVGKLTLAALEATLRTPQTRVDQALHATPESQEARVRALVARLRDADVDATAVPCAGAVGGGGAPGVELPGWAVRLAPSFAAALRTGDPSVVGRLDRGFCLLDLRCVPPDADPSVAAAVLAVSRRLDGSPCT